jgi:hypothetical protein
MKICSTLSWLRLQQLLVVLLGSWMLTACSGGGVGNGVGPSYLVLVPAGLPAGSPSTKIFECIPSSVQALLYFTDGSVGDFTGRVTWSTSNAGAASVSNGDIPVNGLINQYYSKGVLVPAGPGSAIITATYNGLTASVGVTVGTPSNITVKRIDRNMAVVPSNNATTLGTGTSQDFTVTALEDGVERNIENPNNQIWAFDQLDNGVASVNTAGVVSGEAPGGPLSLRATFPSCGQSAATSISIANVLAVTVQPEFAGNPNLIVGNSELFFAYADFGNGPQQDISTQVVFSSSVPDALAFGAIPNLASAVMPGGPSAVSATFTLGGNTITSLQLNVTTVVDTLQSIAVSPKTGSIVAGSDDLFQFNATGTYSSGATQDITRGVTWSVDEPTIATISNTSGTNGIASSAGPTVGQTTVTATSLTAAVGTTDTATLTTTSQ